MLVAVVVCVVLLIVLTGTIVLVGVSIYCLRVSRKKRDFRLTHKAEVGVYMLPWRQNTAYDRVNNALSRQCVETRILVLIFSDLPKTACQIHNNNNFYRILHCLLA